MEYAYTTLSYSQQKSNELTMKSGKQRKFEIKTKRVAKAKGRPKRKKAWSKNEPLAANQLKLRSPSCLPRFPDFYYDKKFYCRDCGKLEIWTPRQQKWWYEEVGGNIETTAIRCRPCRLKERLRKLEAKRTHLEGLERKLMQ